MTTQISKSEQDERGLLPYPVIIAANSVLAILERGLIMANNEKSKNICSSVFKSGENTTTKSQFTQKWIELINKLEKNKGITAAQR